MKRSRESQEEAPLGIVIAASSADAMLDALESLCLRERAGEVEQIPLAEAVLARVDLDLPGRGRVRIQGWLRAPEFDDVSALPFRSARGFCFVMEVEASRLRPAHALLGDFAGRAQALGHDLLGGHFLLQYHGVERHPGFDPVACDRWLGLPDGAGMRALSHHGTSFDTGLGLENLIAAITAETVPT
jgi:hypothetical protein